MKLSISNIAWNPAEEESIADMMCELGINGVEIAPTAIWPKPLLANEEDIKRYRGFWEDRGIQIVAMQALLYGQPELKIFESDEKRYQTLAYLDKIMKIGNLLGAKALVFGSPKNRLTYDLQPDKISKIAVEFFMNAGDTAANYDMMLCIEANPEAYGCNFITTSSQANDLVEEVASKGFGLHLDAGGMVLGQENIPDTIENYGHSICHFHASEPYLEPLGSGDVNHSLFASLLKKIGYSNWVSVEMRRVNGDNAVDEVKRVLNFLKNTYTD